MDPLSSIALRGFSSSETLLLPSSSLSCLAPPFLLNAVAGEASGSLNHGTCRAFHVITASSMVILIQSLFVFVIQEGTEKQRREHTNRLSPRMLGLATCQESEAPRTEHQRD
ncbi:hypothetical protein QOT17_013364 [Balamuthia mandrillaris]